MSGFARGRFGPRLKEVLYFHATNQTSRRWIPLQYAINNCKLCGTSHISSRHYSGVSNAPRAKLLVTPRLNYPQVRSLGWVPMVLRSVLKIRYLLLGGAVGGGASLARQYDEWKKGLPDTEWLKEIVPEVDIDKFRNS